MRWDFDLCRFDADSIRLEPIESSANGNPRLARQPYLFPWVYLPAAPWLLHKEPLAATKLRSRFQKLLGLSSEKSPAPPAVYAAVDWLNEQCTWQRITAEIAERVEQIGGVLIQQCQGGLVPEWVPTPRFRKRLGGRPRNQPRASQRPHVGLRNAIRRERLARLRQTDPQEQPQPRTMPLGPQLPLPVSVNDPAGSQYHDYQWTVEDVYRYSQQQGFTEEQHQEILELLGL